jgi:HSP20 family protein
MKHPIKKWRAELERGILRAWEGLTEGWQELLTRSNGALTRFARPERRSRGSTGGGAEFPQWSLLAGEVWETAHAVVVRLELPGLKRENIEVSIDRGTLRIRGDKRLAERTQGRTYHLTERAFGRFERAIALPHNIDSTNAEVAYLDGLLTVIVPKTKPSPPTHFPVT